MADDEPRDADEASPEEMAEWDRKNADWRAFIRERVEAGYLWDEDRLTLTHAKDAALSMNQVNTRECTPSCDNARTYVREESPAIQVAPVAHRLRDLSAAEGPAIAA